MPSTRQLAAIMFTDIVGYTALMGNDERNAFMLLEKNRLVHKPVIEEFNGKWIKELGDGIMASFTTVSDAVHAAIRIQDICHKENAYRLRIGIHLGEVVFENEDVFGDGVNIAARIQAAAEPDTIYISEAVHNNVSNKTGIKTRFVREQKLKNVKSPVKIFEVVTSYSKPGSGKAYKNISKDTILAATVILLAILAAGYFSLQNFQGKKKPGAENGLEKSIAILPFTDNSPGKDQAYLGDGIAEEITHSLTILDGLKVIGSTSSSKYKDQQITAKEIGEKLKVGIILDGSIRKSGNILRITAQLINVKDNSTIWSQQFDKEMKDIFSIQDSIARQIVEKLKLTLSQEDNNRLIKKTTSEEVYQLYLKGIYTYKQQDFNKAIEYLQEAIKKDSLFAPPFAWMALAKTWRISRGRMFTDMQAIHEAKDYASRAIRLDPYVAEAYSALALMAWAVELDFPTAKINFEKSIKLNPGASLLKNRYGYFLLWMGEFNKAINLGKEAINLDPADYNGYIVTAQGYKFKKNFMESSRYVEEGKKLFPDFNDFYIIETELKFYTGKNDRVIELGIPHNFKNPDAINSYLAIAYLKKGNLDKCIELTENLRNSATEGNPNKFYSLARIFLYREMKDSSFIFLEKSFLNREPFFSQFKIDPLLEPVRSDPRYQDLYRRFGFDRYKPDL